MYFLYVSELPYLHGGGAARTIRELFRELVKREHTCTSVTPMNTEAHITVDGVTCVRTKVPVPWTRNILRNTSIPRPDVLITQLCGDQWAIDEAAAAGTPSILIVPSFAEYLCSELLGFHSCDRHCLRGVACSWRNNREGIFKKASAIVTSSQFMADAISQFYKIPALAIYPFVNLDQHLVGRTGTRVTMVNGCLPKGASIFASIAQQCPEFLYLLAMGDFPGRGANVAVRAYTDDMRQIWSETKVLLVPSLVAESFGRVCIEAGCNGIPVITSGRGGLVEAAGASAAIPVERVDLWVVEVRKLMTDSNYYSLRSAEIKKHVLQFNPATEVNKLENLALRLTGKVSSSSPADSAVSGHPKVSVVTSLYQSAPYLQGYFDDLEAQTFRDFEVVLVCNDITGEERTIIDSNSSRFSLRTVSVPRESTAASMNRALGLCRGVYITIAAVDDKHTPDALQRYVETLDAHPEISLVYGDYVRKNLCGEVTSKCLAPDFDFGTLKQYCYIGPHPTFRRKVVDSAGYFNEGYKSASDYEFWLRLAARGVKFKHIPLVLSEYLERADSITYLDLNNMVRETQEIQSMYAV